MKTYDTIIIGGGAVGLSTAYYMKEAGLDVLVIEKDTIGNGCSWGNAGFIVPSHFVPLASPGMIGKGLKWMFSPQSPFSVTPKPDIEMIRWLLKFSSYCNKQNVERSGRLIYDLNSESKNLYRQMSKKLNFSMTEKGLLMLYRTRHGEKEERETAQKAAGLGINVTILDRQQIEAIEPAIAGSVTGGAHYATDAHIDPAMMMRKLSDYLAGSIRYETFRDFELSGKTITSVITSGGKYNAKSFVVTAGYFTKQILAKLQFPLLMESGKGYSFKVPMRSRLNTPLILTEARVAVTPLDGQIQFAGTMQIGKSMRSHTRGKIKGIVNSVGDYLPEYKMEDHIPAGVWAGLRPLSPDGLPYIGKSARFSNLYIGSGHAMMGISLAPVTGRILTGILTGISQPNEFRLLSPDRVL